MTKRDKKLTIEEAEKRLMLSSLEDCKKLVERNLVSTPTYTFNAGDRVEYGAWDFCEVREVCENGKFYLIYQETDNIQYGRNLGRKNELRYHRWTELRMYRPLEVREKVEILVKEEELSISYQQRDVRSLLHTHYYFGIDVNPDYQRGNVWTGEQRHMLIDSIFKRIDIGKFTLIQRPYDKEVTHYYEMLDGKQRLLALVDFFEDRFRYKGRYFSELSMSDQNHFESYPASATKSLYNR